MKIEVEVQASPQLLAILESAIGLVQSAATTATEKQEAPAPQPEPQQAPAQPEQPQAVPTAPVQPPQPESQPQQQAPQQASQPEPQPVPTSAPSYTMDQLAVASTQLVDAGKRDELIELLGSFGAQALMDLPQEQYGAFATKLREKGAKI